jgi:hypothetical protein
MFKPNPKAQVTLKFVELFGKEYKPTVKGARLTAVECKSHGYPRDTYLTEIVVDGQTIATGRSIDWRKAYKLLKLEVEKLYADGLSLV